MRRAKGCRERLPYAVPGVVPIEEIAAKSAGSDGRLQNASAGLRIHLLREGEIAIQSE